MVTDINKEKFEKWLQKQIDQSQVLNQICDYYGFIGVPFEMQIGVYSKYYKDVHNIDIAVNLVTVKNELKKMNEIINQKK